MRWLSVLCGLALVACYDAAGITPCVLTCDTATPCPNGLECGSDRLCHGAAADICTAIDAGDSDASNTADAARDAGFRLPDDCPSDYGVTIGSTPSRYRVIADIPGKRGPFWDQDTACAADIAGATHLATISSLAERDQLTAQVANGKYYVGEVQKPTANFAELGWLGFDGEQVPGVWAVTEPDDLGDGESNHDDQVGMLDTSLGLVDATGLVPVGAICECDGIPVDATARMYVTDDPNNPN